MKPSGVTRRSDPNPLNRALSAITLTGRPGATTTPEKRSVATTG